MEQKCSNCIYWKNHQCEVIHEFKNDGVCICGCFRPRQ